MSTERPSVFGGVTSEPDLMRDLARSLNTNHAQGRRGQDQPTGDSMSHYTVNESIGSIDDLRAMFPTGEADELNWCFLSTSGVHGSYRTLHDIERGPDDEDFEDSMVTVLVVAPRMVRCNYGHIEIAKDDIPWLRQLVRSTLRAVSKSQEGNTAV